MYFRVRAPHIAHILAVVPKQAEGVVEWRKAFGKQWDECLPEQTGITQLRKSRLSTLDLGLAACAALYQNQKPPQAIISITQTAARAIPGNAALLAAAMGWQGRGKAAPLCWDFSMGCAGMVWGMYQAALLLQQAGIHEVLLVCAETHSRIIAPTDRASRLLFGDGVAAMRLCKQKTKENWHFALGSEPDGGQLLGCNPAAYLQMDGIGVFNFVVKTVVPAIEAYLEHQKLSKNDISCFLMHQASGFVLKYLQRILQIPDEKMPIALDGYGNTASASIGILLAHHFAENENPALKNALLVGFGSGLQWGVLQCDLSRTKIGRMRYEG